MEGRGIRWGLIGAVSLGTLAACSRQASSEPVVVVPPPHVEQPSQLPPKCGTQIPRDCTLETCSRGRGCLVAGGSSLRDIDWLNEGEKDEGGALTLLATSSRFTDEKEVRHNAEGGMAAVAAVRVIEYMVGRDVVQLAFGSGWTSGTAGEGYRVTGQLAQISVSAVVGKAKGYTLGKYAVFALHAPGRETVLQGFTQVVVKKSDLKTCAEALRDSLNPDSPKIKTLDDAAKALAHEMHGAVVAAMARGWE